MYKKILVKYGELTLKKKNRFDFIRKLESNINKILNIRCKAQFDKLFIDYSEENLANLQYVFGISFYAPVVEAAVDIVEMEKTVLKLINAGTYKTFRITSHRNAKLLSLTTQEINVRIGAYVVENTDLKVSLKNFDVEIILEVHAETTYIYSRKIKGLGGLPTGINGRVLHLISGGIDSPVAAFLLMKRGLHVDFINFITPPHTDQKTDEKVISLIEKVTKYQGESILYKINFTHILNLLSLSHVPAYKMILMRRSFYRIANDIAIKNNYPVLSNGENLGQVASQTLESLVTIREVTRLPILSPLLTYDKNEIIEVANKIGTYETSIIVATETCEFFAPKRPITKPKIEKAIFLEKRLNLIDNLEKTVIASIIKIQTKN